MPKDFQLCIWDNNQFQKIYYTHYNKDMNCDMCDYDLYNKYDDDYHDYDVYEYDDES